ncbi:MAG: trypsin-like peptidase domain-containing protein [Candidatus Eremiobacteraeota bacterium]|nr:trypsin-like peptidase domain-containing protein [Candidatus Eremiobacteraeota bacterium]
MTRVSRLLALALSAVLLSACASTTSDANEGDPYVRAFRSVRPSVVLLTMKIPSDKKKGEWDDAFGSGLVVASGDWGTQIATEEHVIHGARDLHVTYNEKTTAQARVAARDVKNDLALVETSATGLVPARLGISSRLEPGTQIGIAGFPIPDAFQDEGLGVATSLYSGRVAAIRRDALELDAPIIPGESGGPVFEVAGGTIVGLAESRFEEEPRIGFAIPIEEVKKFLSGKLHR